MVHRSLIAALRSSPAVHDCRGHIQWLAFPEASCRRRQGHQHCESLQEAQCGAWSSGLDHLQWAKKSDASPVHTGSQGAQSVRLDRTSLPLPVGVLPARFDEEQHVSTADSLGCQMAGHWIQSGYPPLCSGSPVPQRQTG